MKIETAEMSEQVATEELVHELVRNDARRGEFDWESEQDGAGSWTFSPTAGMPPFVKILCYVAAAIAIVIAVPLISLKLYDAIKTALRPNAGMGDWISVGFFTLFACVFIGGPVMQLVKWLRTRGKVREAHERTIPMDGIRLRRMLPNGLVFMALWCIGWDAASFYGIVPKFIDGVRAYSEKGFDGVLAIGVVFPLIGVAMTVYFFRLLWKHLRPSYEVRLAGGLLKEGERATFEYRFKGDAEEVKSVVFATAACAACEARHGTVGAQPGGINDVKEFTHSLEIASGSVTLKMPRIAKDCHTDFKYYFRATVVFKSGLSVASSYRIPLK